MKPCDISFSKRCALGAGLLILLNVLLTGTALAGTISAGPPPSLERASFRLRPTAASKQTGQREPGLRGLGGAAASQSIGAGLRPATNSPAPQSAFDAFVDSVRNGVAGVVRGVYVPGVLALRVVQQAAGNATQVNLAPGTTTQYHAASAWGVTGLLADDASSGTLFYALADGQDVRLVFGDGSTQSYHVSAVYRYQALSPNDPYSEFIDLSTGEHIGAVDLFNRMYAGANHVTFQTCIAQGGLLSWGRLFVIATPD